MTQPRTQDDWNALFKQDVTDNHIFVYAKGEKNMPVCGFSARVMQVFNHLGVPYEVRNIFSDPELRPALCTFSNWPTTPQVFINGEFVGGCDIVTEMFESGELQELIDKTAPQAQG